MAELNPDIGPGGRPNLASDPDDVVATLNDDRIVEHRRVLQHVVLSGIEFDDDLAILDIAVAQRHGDRVAESRWSPGERRRL